MWRQALGPLSCAAVVLTLMTSSLAACSSSGEQNAGLSANSSTNESTESKPADSPASGWTQEEAAMIDQWRHLNEQCRGGSGDNPATMEACDARDTASARLRTAGICYGRQGQYGYQMEMHRCDGQSLRGGDL
jgi:hypothetical protein